MKKSAPLLASLLIALVAPLQANLLCENVITAGKKGYSDSWALALGEEALYAAGSFEKEIAFPGGLDLTIDLFGIKSYGWIAKFDRNLDEVEWAKPIEGFYTQPQDAALPKIIIAGAPTQSQLCVVGQRLPAVYAQQGLWIAWYDEKGNLIEEKIHGSPYCNGEYYSVDLDPSGNPIAAGTWREAGNMTSQFDDIVLHRESNSQPFVVKYDAITRDVLWATTVVTGLTTGTIASTDSEGYTTMATYFWDYVYSLDENLGEPFIHFANWGENWKKPAHLFLMRLDPQGKIVWTRTLGGEAFNSPADHLQRRADHHRIVSTPDGGALLATSFAGKARFGAFEHEALGQCDAILLKIDSEGEVLWTVHLSSSGDDFGFAVECDADKIWAAFHVGLGINTVGSDIALLELDHEGKVLDGNLYGVLQNDGYERTCNDIVTDGSGEVFFTGGFESPTFNLYPFELQRSPESEMDIYIGKISP